MAPGEEILADLWRFTAVHPEWQEGEDWDAEVAWWAVRTPTGSPEPLPGELRAFDLPRDDEIALWLPDQHALVFGDVMLRDGQGRLTMCPESWVARTGGWARLRQALIPLAELGPHHVLASPGPLVLGDGGESFPAAMAADS